MPAATPLVTTKKSRLRKGTCSTILSSLAFPELQCKWTQTHAEFQNSWRLPLAYTLHMAIWLLSEISLHSSHFTAHRATSLHLIAGCLQDGFPNLSTPRLFSVLTACHKGVVKHTAKDNSSTIQGYFKERLWMLPIYVSGLFEGCFS